MRYNLRHLPDEYAAAQAILGATQHFHFPHHLGEVLERCILPSPEYARERLALVRREAGVPYEAVATALDNAYAVHLGMPTIPRPAPYTLASPEAFERHLADEADSRIHSRQVLSALTRSLGLTDPEQTPLHQVHYQLAHYYQLLRARLALWKAVEARLNGPSAI
ncbi:MAG: hypothetical protein KatS3mg071_1602 [Meiothermus sp.]|nr:MAG: hypothetical protein KatS3mg071_1602 [Meiothermus sp.]